MPLLTHPCQRGVVILLAGMISSASFSDSAQGQSARNRGGNRDSGNYRGGGTPGVDYRRSNLSGRNDSRYRSKNSNRNYPGGNYRGAGRSRYERGTNRYRGNYEGYRGYPGRSGGIYVGTYPYGLSYGYRSGNFGIYIAPSSVYGPAIYGYQYPGYAPYSSGGYYTSGYPYYSMPPRYRAPYPPPVTRYSTPPQRYETSKRETRDPSPNVIPTNVNATAMQAIAEKSLRAGNFRNAVRYSIRAVAADPENGRLRLSQSVAFFAYGDYRSSTDALREGLALLAEADWGDVLGNQRLLYGSDEYRGQLERLDKYAELHAARFHPQFLVGYHYFCQHDDEMARYFLNKAAALEPNDDLTVQLLNVLGEPTVVPGDSTNIDTAEELPVGNHLGSDDE